MTDREFEERVLKFDQRRDFIHDTIADLEGFDKAEVFDEISKTPAELIKEVEDEHTNNS